jgi:DHA1 family inner membrane transport protein
VIDRGPGLQAVPWTAALATLLGLAIAALSVHLERARNRATAPSPCLPDAA